MLAAEQLRAARALLRWEQKRLAADANVSLETIKRLESLIGKISAQTGTVEAIVRSLESAGVIFISRNGEGPGVRLTRSRQLIVDVLALRDRRLVRQQKRDALGTLFNAYIAELREFYHGDKDAVAKIHSYLVKLRLNVGAELNTVELAEEKELLDALYDLARKAKQSPK